MLRRVVMALALIVAGRVLGGERAGDGMAEEGTHWIWSHSSRAQGSAAELRKRFSMSEDVDTATVHCDVDFCAATVTLNGTQVAQLGPYDALPPAEVKRHIRSGENVLVVRAVGTGGPAAVAVELTVTSVQGTQQVIHSDSSWESSDSSGPNSVATFGRVDEEPWWNVTEPLSVNAFDDYNQWEEALGAAPSIDAGRFQVPQDFHIDLVYRAREDEGSWISLAQDPQGRLYVGREDTGILRITLAKSGDGNPTVELINGSLQGCHGLLWAHHSLYANASDSKALYRLRDTNGDDRFDDVRLLKQIPGGTGDHGRNDLILGRDGAIYTINGDAVEIPDGFQSRVPATREFRPEGRPSDGHLIRTDADGTTWEVIASGLRNPFGIDVNEDGELFTYDADAEAAVGFPWYRPTRFNHLVSGADYGWRGDGRPWPMYYPDSLPPNALVGRSSPTGVKFASRSSFPPRYRRAMIALDWSYGRVLAVHVVPRGASYSMHPEVFLRGRPFNVVDLEIVADGSIYIITGGYKTRAALYRLRYVGPAIAQRQPTSQEVARAAYSSKLRELRRRLESLHYPGAQDAVSIAWPSLDHPDRWIRHAARVAIEHQPVSKWEERVWEETRPERLLRSLMALVRVGPDSSVNAIEHKLRQLSLGHLSTELKLSAVRIAELADEYSEDPRPERSRQVLEQFEPLYPSGDGSLDRELSKLLAKHGSSELVAKTLRVLGNDLSQGDGYHYLSVLAELREGWSPARRSAFFRILLGARLFQGDSRLEKNVRELERAALNNLPESERDTYERLLAHDAVDAEPPPPTRPFVKKWTLADLQISLADRGRDCDLERGAVLFRDTLCSRCHRLGTVGRAFGPDLTTVAARFGRQEILESILTPSKVISSRYKNHVIVTEDGQVVTGQVVGNVFRKSMLRVATDPMRLHDTIEISKHEIIAHQESPTSPMPEGLLDTLSEEEILDLLGYIESGGPRDW